MNLSAPTQLPGTRLALVLALAILPACGSPTDGGGSKPFAISLGAAVADTTATITTTMSGESGTVTSLILSQTGGSSRQLTAGTNVVVDGLEYLANYRACASARSVSGQVAQSCADFATPLSSDPCHAKGVRLAPTDILVEYIPDNPNPGATINLVEGHNCDGSWFTDPSGTGTIDYLDLNNDGRLSYLVVYHVRPNMPNGTKPIQLRLPMFNQGRYLGDATPDNGTILVNGVEVTGRGDTFPPHPACKAESNCVAAQSTSFRGLTAAGAVTP
jgi:hypothetical protein